MKRRNEFSKLEKSSPVSFSRCNCTRLELQKRAHERASERETEREKEREGKRKNIS